MAHDKVNTNGEDSPPVWKIAPEDLGQVLRRATDRAGMSGVEVAHRLGHANSNQVSRWWNGRVGVSDQLGYFVHLARENDEARRVLCEYMGGEPDPGPSDPVLEKRRDLAERAHKLSDNRLVQLQLMALEEAVAAAEAE